MALAKGHHTLDRKTNMEPQLTLHINNNDTVGVTLISVFLIKLKLTAWLEHWRQPCKMLDSSSPKRQSAVE